MDQGKQHDNRSDVDCDEDDHDIDDNGDDDEHNNDENDSNNNNNEQICLFPDKSKIKMIKENRHYLLK